MSICQTMFLDTLPGGRPSVGGVQLTAVLVKHQPSSRSARPADTASSGVERFMILDSLDTGLHIDMPSIGCCALGLANVSE